MGEEDLEESRVREIKRKVWKEKGLKSQKIPPINLGDAGAGI